MTDERLTENFSLSEFIISHTAIRLGLDNTPSASVYANLRNVLAPAMQEIRDLLRVPITIKSGYRCPLLNATVRGSPHSQHLTGNACDFIAPAFGSPSAICALLIKHMAKLKFDQLIFEGGWVHVSFSPRNRNEVLTAHFEHAGVSYTQGLATA